MIGSGIYKMRVDQDVEVRKQYLHTGMPGSELKLVFDKVKGARPV